MYSTHVSEARAGQSSWFHFWRWFEAKSIFIELLSYVIGNGMDYFQDTGADRQQLLYYWETRSQKPEGKRNNSTATPYDDTSEEKLWQKSRCLYHMQTRAATAASPAWFMSPLSVSPGPPWSPHEQLGEIFDWLSGRPHGRYCMSSNGGLFLREWSSFIWVRWLSETLWNALRMRDPLKAPMSNISKGFMERFLVYYVFR